MVVTAPRRGDFLLVVFDSFLQESFLAPLLLYVNEVMGMNGAGDSEKHI
jgi:hypothetical protein